MANRQTNTRSSVFDTFENQLARLGSASENIISATTYPLTRLSRNYMLLNSLYRNSWICNKIVNIIPEDMMKNGWDVTAELKPEETDRIKKLEQRTLVREKILEGLYWGRLYGGAGAIMIIDGHEDKLDEPLDYDDIMPNSFCGLMVVDRWSGIYPGLELITDHRDPELGMPMFYEVKDNSTDKLISKVHHTRVLRFTGKKLPFWEETAEMHWGSSIMEHVYEELLKRDSTSWNIASLVFQANLLVDKIDGMDQMLAATDPEAQKNFYNIKSAQNQMRSNNGMMIIGKDEELSALNYTFTGLNEISESQMMDIAGAADIPITKLFGRSPSGLNATGESDLQNYYDMISQQQEAVLKPKINKLQPVIFMSELGYIPDDLGIKFNPVATPTDDKVAEIVGKKVESLSKTFNDGGISHKMYLTELHELSYTTNMYTSITDEDIAAADNKPRPPGEDMPDLGMLEDSYSQGQARDSLALSFGGKYQDWQYIYKLLSQNYPKETLEWVKNTEWKYVPNVVLNQIKMARRPGGRDLKKVKNITKAIKAGESVDTVVLVQTNDGYEIADGYHRTLAYEHVGVKTIPAYICTDADEYGPWKNEMHEKKLN